MWHRLLLACLLTACSTAKTGTAGGLADAAVAADSTGLSDTDVPTALADGTTALDAGDDFHCIDGQLACLNIGASKHCVGGGWKLLAKCQDGTFCKAGACVTAADCKPGQVLGCGGYAIENVCDAEGKAIVPTPCKGKQQCAAGACRDVVCTPYSPECTGKTTFHNCLDDGSGFGAQTDCKSGAVCLGGTCLSLCESNLKIASNVGCEYWSVDLDNDPSAPPLGGNPDGLTPEMVPHSVVIANPGIYDAKLTFTLQSSCLDGAMCAPTKTTCSKKSTVCGTPGAEYALAFADDMVPAGSSREFKMPVMNVDGSSVSRKAIHVKSTQPVVAFQFNPFNSEGAASNDASLLLPQNTLGNLYFGVSMASSPDIPQFPSLSQHGFLTVVAASPGTTTVQVTPTAAVIASPKNGVPQDGSKPASLLAGTTYTFVLEPFDVLNLESVGGLTTSGSKDLTGTRIQADKPVAVFGGHENTSVTDDIKKGDENFETCCTEHLEEQLMPAEAWGNEAFCIKSKSRGYDRDTWIVVAGQDAVVLTTVPAIPGLDGKTLLKAGNSIRVQTDESFRLQASGKIQVVQFLVGQGQTADKIGDPTMMLVPPQKQYRTDYLIQTADGYGTNWTTVVRPKGLQVKLDGSALSNAEFQAFGDGTWEYAWHQVQKGTHTFTADQAFGLMAYGYGNVTAYGYPGGMNLQW